MCTGGRVCRNVVYFYWGVCVQVCVEPQPFSKSADTLCHRWQVIDRQEFSVTQAFAYISSITLCMSAWNSSRQCTQELLASSAGD